MIGKLYRVLYKAEGGGPCWEWVGLFRAALPVDRQVQPVEGVEWVGQAGLQLQLG